MTRCLSWCAGCAAAILPVAAQESAMPPLEPTPQQAFVAPGAPEIPEAEPVLVAEPAAVAAPAPAGGVAGESAFDWWLARAEKPTPVYQRWLESLFSLIAPGEPYRRDKLVLTLGTSIGYDDNVLYSPIDPVGSSFYGVNALVDYHFGSRRLKLDANVSAGVNYFENRPGGSNDRNSALTLGLEYRLLPRLGISFRTYTSYLSQPQPQLIGGIFQYTGSYFYSDNKLDLNYQVRPRFGISMGYDYNVLNYDDELLNQSSGFYQQTFSLSGNWLLSPRTTFILQYRYNPVSYYESGFGSTGQFLLVGLQQSLSPRLTYTFLFGAEYRSIENTLPGAIDSYLGPFAEGTLTYEFAPRSKLVGDMRLGTEPSGSVSIRRTFRASLAVNHSIGSRLSLEGVLGVERDVYDETVAEDFTQDIYSASIALRYQFALYTSVVLREAYMDVVGSNENGSYTHNAVSIGLEVSF